MARSVKLPTGFKDEAAFLQDAREKFQQAVDFDRTNRDAAIEDLKFLAGDQWDEDAKASRTGLPCLTINTLPQFVAQVVGDIRINRPAIKVRPAEDADKDLADIREGLIRAIERDNDAQGVYAQAGQNQVACGIGNYRIALKYASDDGFERDIAIEAIPNPFAVAWDPLSTERTGKDAAYCFVVDEVPRKEFIARYKDDLPSELTIPLSDANGWHNVDTVRVTEYWIVKETPQMMALLEGGQVVPADKVPAGVQPIQMRTVRRKSACMYLISGTAILDGPYELPIDRLPIIRVQGWEINVGDKRTRFGLVRFAKDPARLRNYWRSVTAQTIAMAPKGKWLLHETAVPEDGEDDFRTAAKSNDPLLKWAGSVKPEYTSPPQMPTALLQEAALNAQDIKDVTGLHDASLGARSNETSGKAIQARQREGDVATYVYHDNLHAAIKEGGRVVNQLIPVVFDTPRTIRAVGEDDAVKVHRINDPENPDSVDINKGKYDIAIETGPSYSTKRVEAAESMAQFFQVVPAAAQAAGDLFAKAQDWPLAEEIGARLKKTLPPQLVEEDDEEKTPEAMQAKQAATQQAQQQQAMQAKAADAEVRKAVAEADEAEFKAQKAKFELELAMKTTGFQLAAGTHEALQPPMPTAAPPEAAQAMQPAPQAPQPPFGQPGSSPPAGFPA